MSTASSSKATRKVTVVETTRRVSTASPTEDRITPSSTGTCRRLSVFQRLGSNTSSKRDEQADVNEEEVDTSYSPLRKQQKPSQQLNLRAHQDSEETTMSEKRKVVVYKNKLQVSSQDSDVPLPQPLKKKKVYTPTTDSDLEGEMKPKKKKKKAAAADDYEDEDGDFDAGQMGPAIKKERKLSPVKKKKKFAQDDYDDDVDEKPAKKVKSKGKKIKQEYNSDSESEEVEKKKKKKKKKAESKSPPDTKKSKKNRDLSEEPTMKKKKKHKKKEKNVYSDSESDQEEVFTSKKSKKRVRSRSWSPANSAAEEPAGTAVKPKKKTKLDKADKKKLKKGALRGESRQGREDSMSSDRSSPAKEDRSPARTKKTNRDYSPSDPLVTDTNEEFSDADHYVKKTKKKKGKGEKGKKVKSRDDDITPPRSREPSEDFNATRSSRERSLERDNDSQLDRSASRDPSRSRQPSRERTQSHERAHSQERTHSRNSRNSRNSRVLSPEDLDRKSNSKRHQDDFDFPAASLSSKRAAEKDDDSSRTVRKISLEKDERKSSGSRRDVFEGSADKRYSPEKPKTSRSGDYEDKYNKSESTHGRNRERSRDKSRDRGGDRGASQAKSSRDKYETTKAADYDDRTAVSQDRREDKTTEERSWRAEGDLDRHGNKRASALRKEREWEEKELTTRDEHVHTAKHDRYQESSRSARTVDQHSRDTEYSRDEQRTRDSSWNRQRDGRDGRDQAYSSRDAVDPRQESRGVHDQYGHYDEKYGYQDSRDHRGGHGQNRGNRDSSTGYRKEADGYVGKSRDSAAYSSQDRGQERNQERGQDRYSRDKYQEQGYRDDQYDQHRSRGGSYSGKTASSRYETSTETAPADLNGFAERFHGYHASKSASVSGVRTRSPSANKDKDEKGRDEKRGFALSPLRGPELVSSVIDKRLQDSDSDEEKRKKKDLQQEPDKKRDGEVDERKILSPDNKSDKSSLGDRSSTSKPSKRSRERSRSRDSTARHSAEESAGTPNVFSPVSSAADITQQSVDDKLVDNLREIRREVETSDRPTSKTDSNAKADTEAKSKGADAKEKVTSTIDSKPEPRKDPADDEKTEEKKEESEDDKPQSHIFGLGSMLAFCEDNGPPPKQSDSQSTVNGKRSDEQEKERDRDKDKRGDRDRRGRDSSANSRGRSDRKDRSLERDRDRDRGDWRRTGGRSERDRDRSGRRARSPAAHDVAYGRSDDRSRDRKSDRDRSGLDRIDPIIEKSAAAAVVNREPSPTQLSWRHKYGNSADDVVADVVTSSTFLRTARSPRGRSPHGSLPGRDRSPLISSRDRDRSPLVVGRSRGRSPIPSSRGRSPHSLRDKSPVVGGRMRVDRSRDRSRGRSRARSGEKDRSRDTRSQDAGSVTTDMDAKQTSSLDSSQKSDVNDGKPRSEMANDKDTRNAPTEETDKSAISDEKMVEGEKELENKEMDTQPPKPANPLNDDVYESISDEELDLFDDEGEDGEYLPPAPTSVIDIDWSMLTEFNKKTESTGQSAGSTDGSDSVPDHRRRLHPGAVLSEIGFSPALLSKKTLQLAHDKVLEANNLTREGMTEEEQVVLNTGISATVQACLHRRRLREQLAGTKLKKSFGLRTDLQARRELMKPVDKLGMRFDVFCAAPQQPADPMHFAQAAALFQRKQPHEGDSAYIAVPSKVGSLVVCK